MDAPQFDALSKALSGGDTRRRVRGALATPNSRRRLLGALAALPVVGGLLSILDDEAEGQGRRKRRKKAHKHGKGRRRTGRGTKTCKPQPASQTCAGKCGSAANNCKQAVNCGPCTGCNPACGADSFCGSGQCKACDVCAGDCTYNTIQAAIDAADDGDTIVLCPGAYGRPGNTSVAGITKNLTLVGAGTGDGGTILDGGSAWSVHPVVQIVAAIDAELGDLKVELRDLTVKGGKLSTNHGVGGGVLVARATATLTRVQVTGNTAELGGGLGIHEDKAEVTLADTSVTHNVASSGGGIYINGGTLILTGASSVSERTLPQCVSVNGGTGCPA